MLSEVIAMPLFPLLIGSSTVLGIGYCCVDVYRNRKRLRDKTPDADLTGYELESAAVDAGLQTLGRATNHAGHAASEAVGEVASGAGAWIEAIAHTLFHH